MSVHWKYKCWQLESVPVAELDCDGDEDEIVLAGGPVDGLEGYLRPRACGLVVCRTWPDGEDSPGADYYYARTAFRTADGRVVCRYSGAARRG